ncbi:MAG: cation transporter [Phycisphaerae bacterium]|nr:cation transporter [Phycisphaerae bacterium]MDZ4831645.1 cation transporter [Phycisphaerae bacterium]
MNSITPIAAANTTLVIEGMSCGHCVAQVTKALAGVPGLEVKSVAIGSAQIVTTQPAAVKAAQASLAEAGYTARTSQAAETASSDNALKSGECCGGSSAVSANPNATGGKPSCCG